MFFQILKHTYLSFKRHVYMSRSVGIMLILLFTLIFFIGQLSKLGRALPHILQEHAPSMQPGEWVFSFVILFFLVDLLIRLAMYPGSQQTVKSYLHLPLHTKTLAWMLVFRSHFNLFNVYHLPFFYSFIRMTINPATSSPILGFTGIVILTFLNQAIWNFYTSFGKSNKSYRYAIWFLVVLTFLLYYLYTPAFMSLSMQLFMGFVNIQPLHFIVPILSVIGLHSFSIQALKTQIPYAFEISSKNITSDLLRSSFVENLLSSIPKYGYLFVLEWKFLLRNRRTRNQFMFLPLVILGLSAVFIFFFNTSQDASFYIIFLMLSGGYGFFHLQYFASWESRYFDFIASRNISTKELFRAKYLFYVSITLLQWIVVSAMSLFFDFSFWLVYSAFALFNCGYGFWFLMLAGIDSATHINPNHSATFNTEGLNLQKYFMILLFYFSILPFILVGAISQQTQLTGILLAVTGLLFLLSHRWWTKILAKRFERKKYKALSAFRIRQ